MAEFSALPSFSLGCPVVARRSRSSADAPWQRLRGPYLLSIDGKRIVKRMSHTKRLVIGLGMMALSVCAALPFRHTAPPASTQGTDSADNQLSLGEGVSLQMPGQTMAAPLPSHPRPPFPAEIDPGDAQEKTGLHGQHDVAALTKPPTLADQYRPLFKPLASTDNSGRVLPLDTQPHALTKPHKRHTIHDGDTLESLALRYLGDAQRAPEILHLNRNVLADPDLLPIGLTIIIPPAGSAAPAEQTAASTSLTPALVPLPTDGFRRGR
ncbi:MAG: LysM peptidoglycan-binding domain-containing protein [Pirellulaceae bacterium]